jgi:hypothetical protein
MKTFFALVAVGGLLAAAGCTSSSKLDEETWCAKVAETECSWIYSCCNLGERLALTGLNAHEESEPTCREQLTAQCLDDWGVVLASVKAGRLSFDFEQADACLDGMKTTASQCPATMEEPDECEHVVAGLVGIDGECAYDSECAGQARCRRVGNGAAGRCYDKSGEGGLCESTLDCQDSFFCYQGSSPQYVCVALPTVGPGASCGGTVACDQGYFCDPETDRCIARKASGETCSTSYPGMCQEGLVCEYSGRCGAGLGVNQTCSYSDVCGAGLYCDSSTYMCTALKGVGSTCYAATECDQNAYCDGNTDRCVARHASGESCATGYDSCQPLFGCAPRGNCQARGDVGSECYSDDMCLAKLDCSSTNRICEMRPLKLPTGSFCLEDTECESSQCVSNECIGFCTGEI